METRTRPDPALLPVELAVEAHGDAPALMGGGLQLSGVELAARADEVSERLGPGRRLVVVPMANDVGSVVAYLGARRGGHVVLLADPDRLDAAMDAWNPDAVVAGDGIDAQVELRRTSSSHDLHPELAVLLSTSGSTGSPKCVRLSHTNLSSNARSIARYLDLRVDDRAITSLPLHYCYGLSVLHSHLAVGAAVVVSDTSVVDPCFWRAVDEHAVTSIAAVPHMLDLIDRVGPERLAVPSLRRLTVAGGRAPAGTVVRYATLGQQHGWDLFVMYGQTEATARMAYLPPELALAHPSSIGVAVPGGQLDLAPPQDADVADGVGELVYRGDNVMMGYATSPTDLGRGDEVAVLRTGDLARRTHEGLFEIVGRPGRVTKMFGLRLDLDHLEEVLAGRDVPAWCVATPAGLAVCSVAPVERTTAALRDVVSLPRSAVTVVRVAELPRLANGKPDRSGVADLCGAASPAGEQAAVGGDHGVRAVLRRSLGCDDVRDDDTFVALGGDSLSYIEVSLALEQLLGDLPSGWHLMPVAELERRAAAGVAEPRRGLLAGWRTVETTLVLRAAAIVLVVVSHVGVLRVRGGAHVLLAIAGFNFARFLVRSDAPTLRPDTIRSIARIGIPASVWLTLLVLWSSGYDWSGVWLLNSYLGPPRWTSAWRYWFIEALVLILIVATLVTSVPFVRRLERRQPIAVPAVLLAFTLLARFDVVTIGATPEPLLAPHRVAWCFVLGWLIARADRTVWRIAATLVTLLVVPGFFGETGRDLVVVAGLVVLTWWPTLKVPRQLTGLIGVLAGASLYIYLTHYQVYLPLADRGVPGWVGILCSIGAGVVLWRLADPVVERCLSRSGHVRVPS